MNVLSEQRRKLPATCQWRKWRQPCQ